MIDKPNSPLRQRMTEDMTARRFTEKVQKDYIRHVRNFAVFLRRSPDAATAEDVRLFQLHMANRQIGAPTINAAVAALRFFFNVTLERPELARHLAGVHKPRRAPVVLNQEEVARLLEAAPGLKYKAAFGVAYGAGLRVSEVVALKVSDIDSKRMTLRVEQGKGRRDRYVMLSPQLLEWPHAVADDFHDRQHWHGNYRAGDESRLCSLGAFPDEFRNFARGRADMPKIVAWYVEGKINIDDLVTHTMRLTIAPCA